jgi:competence protein ComEC
MLNLLALLGGIIAVSHFPVLPVLHLGYLLAITVLALFRFTRPLAMAGLGLCWGVLAGQQLVDQQLPADLEGVEIRVSGDVIDLPQDRDLGQRFLFRIDKAEILDAGIIPAQSFEIPSKVLLTWYEEGAVAVGQRWQFVVKMKRPRALVNEGGFDYQRWLLSRGISATGYIRQSASNTQLSPQQTYPVQNFRSRIRSWILTHANFDAKGPILALAIGDNSFMSPEQWLLFRQTGTGHLMAISGLHIGLIAVFGFFLGRFVSTAITVLGKHGRSLRLLPNLFSCLCAITYAALAGFGLPTQRALVMVLILNLALILGRGHRPLRALVLAALVVLLIDPLAGLDMGFWLSFGAVAVLIAYFQYRHQALTGKIPGINKTVGFARAQVVVFIGLMLPLLAFNTPLSLLAPLANLVVIPLVSLFAVVPLLIGIALQSISLELANLCLSVVEFTLQTSFRWLRLLVELDLPAFWSPSGSSSSPVLIGLAILGVGMLLIAQGFPGRWLGVLLLLPILFPKLPDKDPLHVTVLDVGQGLAVVVQTPAHTLLYDAGARFSDRFDTGEAVVLAYLRYHGIKYIDTFVVSHGDNDHAGGAEAVLAGIRVDQIIVGEPLNNIVRTTEACDSNRRWQWQAVSFALIEPQIEVEDRDNNNLSCILVITYRDQHLLLPGDIEAPIERALLAQQQLPSPLQTIIAPHHGSRTSSTPAFVKTLHPDRAVFSAAYRSRYGHPHPLVTERYQQRGAALYNTADAGQIDIRWSEAGEVEITQLRERRPRYWY